MNNKELHPKVAKAIRSFNVYKNSNMAFFYYFLNYVNIVEDNSNGMGTMYAAIKKTGLQIGYNKKFVEDLSIPEIAGVLAHEVLHFTSFHAIRYASYRFNHKFSNIAQDNYINYTLKYKFSNGNYRDKAEEIEECPYIIKGGILTELPPDFLKEYDKVYYEYLYFYYAKQRLEYEKEKSEHGSFKPQEKFTANPYDGSVKKNYDNDENIKELEDELEQNQDKLSDKQKKNIQDFINDKKGGFNPTESKSSFNKPDENGIYPDGHKSEVNKEMRDLLDMFDTWNNGMGFDHHVKPEDFMEKGMSAAEGERMVSGVIDALKTRGLCPGAYDEFITNIKKKKKDYLKHVKKQISLLFKRNKSKTYSVPNMYGFENLKGFKKNGFVINWLSDTSGSMWEMQQKTAAYLLQNDIQINLIQIDAEIQSERIISKKDFIKFKIKGGGGTVLQPALDLIKKDKNYKNCHTVITTDGYTDDLDFSGYDKNVLYITTGEVGKLLNINKTKLRIIEVDKELL